MRNAILAAVAVATLGAAGVARAGPAPRTHDGFFLQMDLGGGTLSTKSTTYTAFIGASPITGKLEMSGGAPEFSIALGGALTPNFVLAGQLWGITVSSPDVKFAGITGNSTDTTQTLSGVGIYLAYYVMPLNLYVAATPSIGTLSLKQGGNEFSTKSGFAMKLAVGKEWWVSDNWGLGLNVQYAFASNEDNGTNPPTFSSNWFGLAFSATYN